MLSFAPEVRHEEPREGGLSQGDRVQSLSVTLSDQEPKSPQVCPQTACFLLLLGVIAGRDAVSPKAKCPKVGGLSLCGWGYLSLRLLDLLTWDC